VAAKKLAHVEPDAAHQRPGRQVVRVEVLSDSAGGAPIGDVQLQPNPPFGSRFNAPVDPPTWLRLHLADGEHVDWLSGASPPPGFRFQINPSSGFRNFGFSGGHTRDAWAETMRLYGDQIRELPAEHLAFTLPGRKAPIDVSIQPYEVRGVASPSGEIPWVRVNYPKSIFEGAGASSLSDFETHMAPHVAAALNAKPTAKLLDVDVPVSSLAGQPVVLRIRVARDVPADVVSSWWVSESGIDPRLRLEDSAKSPIEGGPP